MTKEEIISSLEEQAKDKDCFAEIYPGNFRAIFAQDAKALREAANLLRPLCQLDRPLTLDELRGMEDIPVWIVGGTDAYIDANGYGVVNFYEFYSDRACIFWPGNEVEATPRVEDYGRTWLAYRYRPKVPANA